MYHVHALSVDGLEDYLNDLPDNLAFLLIISYDGYILVVHAEGLTRD